MANFCSNCGAQQQGNSAFCVSCGARQVGNAPQPSAPQPNSRQQGPAAPQNPPPPAQSAANPPSYNQPPYGQQQPYTQPSHPQQPYNQPPQNPQAFQQAPLPPAKKGSGMKIVLALVVFFMVAGAATVGALWYAAHKVKDAVVERAANAGIDLNSISSPASSRSSVTRTYKACDLFPQADAAVMLGEPIERIEDQGTTCLYYGPAGLSGKLAQQGASDMMKNLQKPGAQPTGNDIADQMSKIMGGLAAQAGAKDVGANGDVPLLTFIVEGDGKPQMTALTATKAIFGGIGKAASDGKEGFGEEIPGLGDRAVRMANLGLNVLHGDTLIRLIPGPVPGANQKSISIARAILPKL